MMGLYLNIHEINFCFRLGMENCICMHHQIPSFRFVSPTFSCVMYDCQARVSHSSSVLPWTHASTSGVGSQVSWFVCHVSGKGQGAHWTAALDLLSPDKIWYHCSLILSWNKVAITSLRRLGLAEMKKINFCLASHKNTSYLVWLMIVYMSMFFSSFSIRMSF